MCEICERNGTEVDDDGQPEIPTDRFHAASDLINRLQFPDHKISDRDVSDVSLVTASWLGMQEIDMLAVAKVLRMMVDRELGRGMLGMQMNMLLGGSDSLEQSFAHLQDEMLGVTFAMFRAGVAWGRETPVDAEIKPLKHTGPSKGEGHHL